LTFTSALRKRVVFFSLGARDVLSLHLNSTIGVGSFWGNQLEHGYFCKSANDRLPLRFRDYTVNIWNIGSPCCWGTLLFEERARAPAVWRSHTEHWNISSPCCMLLGVPCFLTFAAAPHKRVVCCDLEARAVLSLSQFNHRSGVILGESVGALLFFARARTVVFNFGFVITH